MKRCTYAFALLVALGAAACATEDIDAEDDCAKCDLPADYELPFEEGTAIPLHVLSYGTDGDEVNFRGDFRNALYDITIHVQFYYINIYQQRVYDDFSPEQIPLSASEEAQVDVPEDATHFQVTAMGRLFPPWIGKRYLGAPIRTVKLGSATTSVEDLQNSSQRLFSAPKFTTIYLYQANDVAGLMTIGDANGEHHKLNLSSVPWVNRVRLRDNAGFPEPVAIPAYTEGGQGEMRWAGRHNMGGGLKTDTFTFDETGNRHFVIDTFRGETMSLLDFVKAYDDL